MDRWHHGSIPAMHRAAQSFSKLRSARTLDGSSWIANAQGGAPSPRVPQGAWASRHIFHRQRRTRMAVADQTLAHPMTTKRKPGPHSAPASLLVPEKLATLVHYLRREKIILDSDLAELYGVDTGALNRAVKRNIERFPADFMFQLTETEEAALRCQTGILNADAANLRSQSATSKNTGNSLRSNPNSSSKPSNNSSPLVLVPGIANRRRTFRRTRLSHHPIRHCREKVTLPSQSLIPEF